MRCYLWVLGLSALVLAGCSNANVLPGGSDAGASIGQFTTSATGPSMQVAAPVPPVVPAGKPALSLQAGDKIKVTVFGEDKITGEYDVDPSGYVSLPLAGSVYAGGLTKVRLEEALTEKLKSNYLKDPKVTVDVVNFRPIYVLGEVQKPGEYPYKSGLNVMSSVAVAGGSTYRASNSRILIQRFGETVLKEYPLDPSISVMPGDVIRLPERYF